MISALATRIAAVMGLLAVTLDKPASGNEWERGVHAASTHASQHA
ncbi:MAG TPA: hypothetical protein VFV23_11750 [Verrucomicrobiae bacterium]|nr:hypothetical protein [Verrucomicrobiae bacterium]